MVKIAILLLVLAVYARADDSTDLEKNESGRQKRLLFFDEGGALVQTYSNPYLNNLALNADRLPNYGNILNPFFNFIQAFGNSLAAFTIPVSNAIVQQIKHDPNFQNSLVVIPKNPVVEPNPHCEGLRTQVPSPAFCNNFLNCWDGWAVEQECPTGLLFSKNGYCDYADNVDCHNRKVNVEKLQPQVQPVCKTDFETFRNNMDCSEFFVCVNRQPVRFKCPADLSYSQVLGVCDYADKVDCKSNAAPANPPFQPTYPNMIPNLPSSVGPIMILQTPALPQAPAVPQAPTLPQAPAVPQAPALPQTPTLPQSPALSETPALPQSPELPQIPASPASSESVPEPSLPSSPPSSFPSLPINPPFAYLPTIPSKFPSPSFVPPGASISPGSPDIPSSPMIPPATSNLRPSFIKPVPPAFQEEYLSSLADKPGSGIFTPGCASANVAMSRQDAIRQLQGQLTY